MHRFIKAYLCYCTIFLIFTGNVYANPKVVERLAATQITLTKAIKIAEAEVNGQAYKAKLETNSFGLEYEVDLIVDGARVEVSVNALTQEVIKVRKK